MTSVLAADAPVHPAWQVLSSFGYFVTLAMSVGFVLTYVIAVRPALRDTACTAVDKAILHRRSALLLAISGALLLASAYFDLANRTARATKGVGYGQALAPRRIAAFLQAPPKAGNWISAGTVQVVHLVFLVAAGLLLIPLFSARLRDRVDTLAIIAAPPVVLTSLARSVPVDVRSVSLDTVAQPLAIQIHIVGGMVWIGGLFLLILVTRVRTSLSTGSGAVFALVWQRFSTVALTAVGGILLSGLWLTWKEFGTPEQLWSTTFGQFLLVKLCFVACMIGAGGINQFWLLPRIARRLVEGNHRSVWKLTLQHFPRLVTVEAILGIGVLTVVPFLTGSPRREAGDTGPEHSTSPEILVIGAAVALMLVGSFVATVRASEALARRSSMGT